MKAETPQLGTPVVTDAPAVFDAEADLALSIIILNWNTSALLEACLRSLAAALIRPDYEVFVVDNGSSDGSPEMVLDRFPAVRLITLFENTGFSRGNNAALRHSRGRYVLLLNSDTEVIESALESMCVRMGSDPAIGALGSQLLNPDGTVQLSCRTFPSYKTALFHRKSLLTRLFPNNRYSREYLLTGESHDESMEVDWVIGACLMTRREVMERVGLLDEEFFMYAEDVDWCYRIRQDGWKVVYHPDAKVMHHYEKSASKVPYRMNLERHRSMWRFYTKHYSRGIVLLDLATALGISTRFLLTVGRNAAQSITGGTRQP